MNCGASKFNGCNVCWRKISCKWHDDLWDRKMTKIKDLEWFCPQPFMNTLVYRTVAPMSCCVIKNWPKSKIKSKYGTTDLKSYIMKKNTLILEMSF